MRQRLLTSLFVLALVTSVIVAAVSPAGADAPKYSGVEWVFFPWVPNGEFLDGTGPWYGTVTIQNLEDEPIVISTHSTAGGSSNFSTTLNTRGSTTLSPSQMEISSPGGGVAISAVFQSPKLLPEDDDIPSDEKISVPPKIAAVMKQAAAVPPTSTAKTSSAHMSVDGHTGIPAQDVPWGVLSSFCDDIAGEYCNALGEYFLGLGIGGFDGHSYLPIAQTNNGWNSVIHVSNIDDSSPAGARVSLIFYSADQQGWASSSWHGIVFDHFLDPGDTWTFNLKNEGFPDDWVGSVKILSDYGVVTSVSRVKPETNMLVTNTAAPSLLAITSIDGHDVPPQNNLLSLESSVQHESIGIEGQFQMYAPLVFKEYNGWNTGISIVNIAEVQNTVGITFYGPTGNVVHQDSLTISAQGMEFVFLPSDPSLMHEKGFVGSVIFTSLLPFHVAIDQVKYTTGEAMSYIATAAAARAFQWEEFNNLDLDEFEHLSAFAPSLAMPLVQKGSPITGLGDTSGIQLFNIHGSQSVKFDVQFYHHTGTLAQPTMQTPLKLELGPFQNLTLYTMTYNSMLQNFNGSVVVTPTSGKGALVGVSNNVNYDVMGDGAAAFNMVNTWGQFRFGLSQTQLFAYSIELVHRPNDNPCDIDAVDPSHAECSVDDNAILVATVRDQFDKPLPGVLVNFNVDNVGNPDPTFGSGYTNINGQVTFSFTNDTPDITNTITASAIGAGLSDTATVDWLVGAPVSVEFIDWEEYDDDGSIVPANAFSAGTGETMNMAAIVRDQFDNPVPNVNVNFSVNNVGNPAPDADSDITNNDGVAFFAFTNTAAVTNTVTAAIPGDSDTATVEWIAQPQVLEAFVAQPNPGDGVDLASDPTIEGQYALITGKVTDNFGNPVAGIPVTFNHTQNRGGFATLGNQPNNHGDTVANLVVNTGVDGTVTVWFRQRNSQFPGNSTITVSAADRPPVQGVVTFAATP